MSCMNIIITNPFPYRRYASYLHVGSDTVIIYKNSLKVLMNTELANLSVFKTLGTMPSGSGDIFIFVYFVNSV